MAPWPGYLIAAVVSSDIFLFQFSFSSPTFFTPSFQSALLQNRVDDFIREAAAGGLANKPVAPFQQGTGAWFLIASGLVDMAEAMSPLKGGKSGKIACQGFHGLHNIVYRLMHALAVRTDL
jgi:hypothetical protein